MSKYKTILMENKLMAIEMNMGERLNIMLLNIIKMLSARDLISEKNIKNIHDKLKNTLSDDMIYTISTDTNEKIYIKYIQQKITTINKTIGVTDFLYANKDNKKILVVSNINKKAYKQIIEFPNTEIFWDYEFMLNLIDHIFVPKHIILSDEDRALFLDKYFDKFVQ